MRKANLRFATIALALAVMLAAPLAEYASAQSQPVGPPAASTQVPQPADNSVNWPGAGYGAGALFCNLLYIPAKLVYALLGGIVGGGTYLITAGNMQAANTVWRSSLGGDYVVTPQMLAGQEPINFSGPTDTPPDATTTQATASSATSSTTTTTTANAGSVAPITPLPASGTSGASGTSTTASSSTAASGGQPMYHGSGPAPGAAGGSNIE